MSYNKIEEFTQETTEQLMFHYKAILSLLGEDASREGLIKTPERVAKSMQFLTQGYSADPVAILNSAKFKEDYKQIVLVKDIEIYSLCEHHMLPFYGTAAIAYVPNGEVVGLSKIARTLEVYARRLQLQERLTAQVADAFMENLNAKGVMVLIEAEHMCMTMRGIKKPGTKTVTTVTRGVFAEDEKLRNEFYRMLGK